MSQKNKVNKESENSNQIDYTTPIKEKFGDLPSDFVQELVDDATRGKMNVEGLLSYAEKPVSKFQENQERKQAHEKRSKECKEIIGDDYEDKISKHQSRFKDEGLTEEDIQGMSPRALNTLINSFETQSSTGTQSNWRFNNRNNSMMNETRNPNPTPTKTFEDKKNDSIEFIIKNGRDKSGRLNEAADNKMAEIVSEIMKRRYHY